MLLNASKIVFHCWHVVASFLGWRPGRSWLLGKLWPWCAEKTSALFELHFEFSSSYVSVFSSVFLHIFGQTGTYYLNYNSGSPPYKSASLRLQCFLTHTWAEWKYLSWVPNVVAPMCQSALGCTGWFCTVKYLNCILSSPPPSPSSPL